MFWKPLRRFKHCLLLDQRLRTGISLSTVIYTFILLKIFICTMRCDSVFIFVQIIAKTCVVNSPATTLIAAGSCVRANERFMS